MKFHYNPVQGRRILIIMAIMLVIGVVGVHSHVVFDGIEEHQATGFFSSTGHHIGTYDDRYTIYMGEAYYESIKMVGDIEGYDVDHWQFKEASNYKNGQEVTITYLVDVSYDVHAEFAINAAFIMGWIALLILTVFNFLMAIQLLEQWVKGEDLIVFPEPKEEDEEKDK